MLISLSMHCIIIGHVLIAGSKMHTNGNLQVIVVVVFCCKQWLPLAVREIGLCLKQKTQMTYVSTRSHVLSFL